jgi:ABC-type lipoprotein export system ATPase subunit
LGQRHSNPRRADGGTTDKINGGRASPIGPRPGAAAAFSLAPARYRDPVAVLEARGIRKSVGSGRTRRWVLDDAALTVEADQVVAVLGRSGSGKSTLLHLLGALDRPDAGEIVLAGQVLTAQSPRELARTRLRHVGFVFQSFHLVPELSGTENVMLPARLPGAPAGGDRRARRLIDELGLARVSDHLPHELSGGEQQRFAIARALVNDPELVLADEPTGNLDAESGGGVLSLLRSLERRAVVIVTHEPDAAAIADRVLHLRDGQLVAESELLSRHGVGADDPAGPLRSSRG